MWGSGSTAPLILHLGTRWVVGWRYAPAALPTRMCLQCPLNRRLGGPQNHREIAPVTEISLIVQYE